eukprot:TRINITY_DN5164_c0_g1_i1.p1 TRINITY_DN5164_c0_g1~~TRINITY_DN5164_c0_g1_i1.p1  ORF type:complete len:321 (-),score=75.51 TRINITY_DN5164_c0_g1_i1:644-1555(-)
MSVVLVEDLETLSRVAADLARCDVIGLDCEGRRLSRDGQLSLLQIFSPAHNNVYLIDVLAPEIGLELLRAYLGELLSSERVLKVMHDCRQDSDALFHLAKLKLNNVFDLQMGYNAVLKQQYEAHPKYTEARPFKPSALPIGFAKLLKTYCQQDFAEKEGVRQDMIQNEQYWLQRPLIADQIAYASKDVQFLPKIYTQMKEQLLAANMQQAEVASAARLSEYRDNERGGQDQAATYAKSREDMSVLAKELSFPVVLVESAADLQELVETIRACAGCVSMSCELATVRQTVVIAVLVICCVSKER